MIVYAVLSRSQYIKLSSGEYSIEVPNGVSMSHRAGSKNLFFDCEDEFAGQQLLDGLDVSGISWQIQEE